MYSLTVNVSLDNISHSFQVTGSTTFAEFQQRLRLLFPYTIPLGIVYVDSDGDKITVSSDIELTEFVYTAKKELSSVIPVTLVPQYGGRPVSTDSFLVEDPTESTISSDFQNVDCPQLRLFLCHVSELLNAINSEVLGITEKCSIDTIAFSECPSSSTDSISTLSSRNTVTLRGGPLSELRQYLSIFPSGEAGFRSHAKSVSPEIKAGFRKLVRYIVRSDDSSCIVATLKRSTPILRKWINEELGDSGKPKVAQVDALFDEGKSELMRHLGEKTATRVMEFVVAAMSEASVIDMLREVRGIGLMPWETNLEEDDERGSICSDETDVMKDRGMEFHETDMLSNDLADETVERPAKRHKGIFYFLRPYMDLFPSGRTALRNHLECLPSEIKICFRKLVRFILKADNCSTIVKAIKDTTSLLRTWINEELGDEGIPSTAEVEQIIAVCEAKLLPSIGLKAMRRLSGFVRIALADEGFADMMRELIDMELLPWEEHKDRVSWGEIHASEEAVVSYGSNEVRPVRDTVVTESTYSDAHRNNLNLALLSPDTIHQQPGIPKMHTVLLSAELMKRFVKLIHSIDKSGKGPQFVNAVIDILPIVFNRVRFRERAQAGSEQVAVLLYIVAGRFLPVIGEDRTKEATDILRDVLADPAVLRAINIVGADATSSILSRSLKALASRNMTLPKKETTSIGVHYGTKCESCRATPILGSRFTANNRTKFNFCSQCFYDNSVRKDSMMFREVKFSWEEACGDALIPPPQLKSGDCGPDVQFLHKVLVDLGYMNHGNSCESLTFFGPSMRAALEHFQQDHVVADKYRSGIYDEVTMKHLRMVLEGQRMEFKG